MAWRATERLVVRALVAAAMVAGAGLGGCKPQPPTLTVGDVSLASVGREGVGLVVTLQVHNPNASEMKVKSVTGEIASGTSVLAQATAAEPIPVLPAKGKAEVSARMNVSPSALLAAAGQTGKDRSMDYRITGRCVVADGEVEFALPIAAGGRIAPVEMLRWTFKDAEVFIGDEKPVTLVFDVTNPNAFAMPMAALAGEVTVGGEPLVAVEVSQVKQIPAGATVEVRLAVALKKDGFAKVLAARGGGARLEFQPRVRLISPISLVLKAVKPK